MLTIVKEELLYKSIFKIGEDEFSTNWFIRFLAVLLSNTEMCIENLQLHKLSF